MSQKSIFHAYDIRGVWPQDLDESIAWKIGWAAGEYFKKQSARATPTIIVGEDGRESSPSLSRALQGGLARSGVWLRCGGAMTTPMCYFLVNFFHADGAVMVTASHNSPDYNGFKFVREHARPVFWGGGLEVIEALVLKAPRKKEGSALPHEENLLPHYLEFLQEKFNALFHTTHPRATIVFDNGNGMASKVLEPLLYVLPWVTPIKLFWDQNPRFPGRGPNPVLPGALDHLSRKVLEENADFGVAFDGDGDRTVLVNEHGVPIPSDFVSAYFAKMYLAQYPGGCVVVPIGSSRIVEETVKRAGGSIAFSREGNVFVVEEMMKLNAIVGGEHSGHHYFRDFFFHDSSVFATLAFIYFWSQAREPLSQLFKQFAKYPSSGEINMMLSGREGALEAIKAAYAPKALTTSELDGFYADLGEWWFLLRPSQTEPLLRLTVEGKNKKVVDAHVKEIQTLLNR